MKYKLVKLALVGVAISALVACYDDDDNKRVSSNGVATGQMFATFQVVSDGEADVYAEAQLTLNVPPANASDSSSFIRLVGDDELWLSAGPDIEDISLEDNIFDSFRDIGDTQTIFENTRTQRETYDFLFSRVIINELGTWYSARLPQSEEREYRVVLFRDRDDGVSARDSVVVLPEAFTVSSPVSGTSFSRSADDIEITWSNVDPLSSVEVEAITTCVGNDVDTFSVIEEVDDGAITLSAGDLDSTSLSGVCSTTINIRKYRLGQFDARFIGGAVNGYQIRRVVIVTSS